MTIPRIDPGVLAILLVSLLLRIDLASVRPYLHDEANTALPLSRTISFAPDDLNLPLRGENHGALPAYVVRASTALFGTTPLGSRMMHVLMGTAAILLVALVAGQWYHPVAARWAAALFAFNEYFFFVAARATAHVPYLFFIAAAIYAFSRFLASERPRCLYAAAGLLGVAFYCKEHAALLLPLLMLLLLRTAYRRWLGTPHAYLACGLFLAILLPDIAWNFRTDHETARVSYGDGETRYATYRSHLERIGGIGFSLYPLMFYGRSAVKDLYGRATGGELADETAEYASMNPVLGVLLLGGVVLAAAGRIGGDPLRGTLVFLFCGIFGFFTLIARGSPPGRLDPVSWIWVESTLIFAAVLAGACMAAASGRLRAVSWALAAAALLYGAWMVYT